MQPAPVERLVQHTPVCIGDTGRLLDRRTEAREFANDLMEPRLELMRDGFSMIRQEKYPTTPPITTPTIDVRRRPKLGRRTTASPPRHLVMLIQRASTWTFGGIPE
jgi:hypothetical protein